MKVRNGFVSNSSSSSFILGLREIPQTPNDLKRMLNVGDYPVIEGNYNCQPTDMVINKIFYDIMDISNNNRFVSDIKDMSLNDNFSSEIRYNLDHYDHIISKDNIVRYNELKELVYQYNKDEDKLWVDISDDKHEKFTELREKFDVYVEEISNMVIDALMKNKKDCKIFFELNYSDNDGELDSLIEHGNVLDPITILYFNQH